MILKKKETSVNDWFSVNQEYEKEKYEWISSQKST